MKRAVFVAGVLARVVDPLRAPVEGLSLHPLWQLWMLGQLITAGFVFAAVALAHQRRGQVRR